MSSKEYPKINGGAPDEQRGYATTARYPHMRLIANATNSTVSNRARAAMAEKASKARSAADVLAQAKEAMQERIDNPELEHDVYIAGSLRNPDLMDVHYYLSDNGFSVFSDWRAVGPNADDHWKTYYQGLGMTYQEALKAPASQLVFNFDRNHLLRSRNMLLVLPAGKSGHMELGWFMGKTGRPGYILLDADDVRWDVMYQFATGVSDNKEEIREWIVKGKT